MVFVVNNSGARITVSVTGNGAAGVDYDILDAVWPSLGQSQWTRTVPETIKIHQWFQGGRNFTGTVEPNDLVTVYQDCVAIEHNVAVTAMN
jgi:hypothetical protein